MDGGGSAFNPWYFLSDNLCFRHNEKKEWLVSVSKNPNGKFYVLPGFTRDFRALEFDTCADARKAFDEWAKAHNFKLTDWAV